MPLRRSARTGAGLPVSVLTFRPLKEVRRIACVTAGLLVAPDRVPRCDTTNGITLTSSQPCEARAWISCWDTCSYIAGDVSCGNTACTSYCGCAATGPFVCWAQTNAAATIARVKLRTIIFFILVFSPSGSSSTYLAGPQPVAAGVVVQQIVPGHDNTRVPSFMPGENPILHEFANKWRIPVDAALGGPR